MVVGKAVKRYKGRIVTLREFKRLQAMEQAQTQRVPSSSAEEYDFTYKRGKRSPKSRSLPWDFSQ